MSETRTGADGLTASERKEVESAQEAEEKRQERLDKRTVWNVTLWGVADDADEAEKTVVAVINAARKGGLRSGFANAPNINNVTLTANGIPARRAYLDPTSEEAVSGVGYVKNTPLDDDGLPDPERQVQKSPIITGEVDAASGGKETPKE
jgi:hypothetical protein